MVKEKGGDNQQEINMKVKDTDLAWLAGIIDSEGSIMFYRKAKYSKNTVGTSENRKQNYGWIATGISVTNCDETMIREISQMLYSLDINFHYTLQTNNLRNTKWNVALKIESTGLNTCKKFLVAIIPYLRNKKYLAAFLLEYIEWRQAQGYTNLRKCISKEQINRWFERYEIQRKPKFISPETTRRASLPLGMMV